jgi:hypothetical protein
MSTVRPMKVRGAIIDVAKFVRLERATWRNKNLLAPHALRDFQKLTDETFLDLRSKYFTPADLVAEMAARKEPKTRKKRKKRLVGPENRQAIRPDAT